MRQEVISGFFRKRMGETRRGSYVTWSILKSVGYAPNAQVNRCRKPKAGGYQHGP